MQVRALFATLLLAIAFATPVHAQRQQGSREVEAPVHYKDPGTATIIGVVVVGGGQMYSGETRKGVTLLAMGLGSLFAGTALTVSTGSAGPWALGTLGYLVAWGAGIADAGNSARRMNAAAGTRTAAWRPVVHRDMQDRTAFGVAVAF